MKREIFFALFLSIILFISCKDELIIEPKTIIDTVFVSDSTLPNIHFFLVNNDIENELPDSLFINTDTFPHEFVIKFVAKYDHKKYFHSCSLRISFKLFDPIKGQYAFERSDDNVIDSVDDEVYHQSTFRIYADSNVTPIICTVEDLEHSSISFVRYKYLWVICNE